jgi:DNA ligase-1
MGDTVDLVVMGAYTGRGKRTGMYGGYLLGCYNSDDETYQSICKIGTGLKDDDLKKFSEFFKEHIIPTAKSYYSYGESLNCDVWFEPVQVWEIAFADLQISPVHKAGQGLVDAAKGIGLRFPRFVRIRDDKKPENATNGEQIAELYKSQKINHGHGAKAVADDDDY